MEPLAMTPEPDEDALVAALRPVVAAWCARLGGAGVDGEEATQEVMITLLRRAGSRGAGVRLEVYAYGVTRRILANHRRRAWWRRWIPGEVDEVPARALDDAERNELARQVAAILDRLPFAQREVLVLCDVEERTSAEVAALLGVPDGTVRSRLRLARARFRALAPAFGLHPHPDGAPR